MRYIDADLRREILEPVKGDDYEHVHSHLLVVRAMKDHEFPVTMSPPVIPQPDVV